MNACIVGYGAIGVVHARALSEIDGVNIYAICDVIKERAENGAKEYGAKAVFDFDDCIRDTKIECIHICTPHYLHFEMITKALDAGKKVVVEKPAVMNREELDLLFKNYDVTKIFPIVQNRLNLCIEKLKELVNTKEYGDLKGIKGILTWQRDAEYYQSAEWRGTQKYEGGGVLINQAVHTLDLMTYFAGAAKSVSAAAQNHSLKGVIEVEDTINAYISFKSGAKGLFYATNAYTKNSSVQLEIAFEKDEFIYRHGNLYHNGGQICSDSPAYLGKNYWGAGHAKVLYDYYINGSAFCLADIKDTMEAMFAIYESAGKGSEVLL